MKQIKFIAMIILCTLLVKGLFYVANIGSANTAPAKNVAADIQVTPLVKFISEFVLHNETITYPYKLDEVSVLTHRELMKLNGELYVVEYIKMSIPVSDLPFSTTQIEERLQSRLTSTFCSTVNDREKLFKGYSTVGLLQSYVDSNGTLIAEPNIIRSTCLEKAYKEVRDALAGAGVQSH